jgi:hypothetical protein
LAANLRVLTGLLVALGVLELIDAPLIDGWGFAVAFAVLFFVASWLVRSGRVLPGLILGGLLALFEVVGFSGWDKNSAADWTISVATLVSSVGVFVLLGRHLMLRRAEGSPATD